VNISFGVLQVLLAAEKARRIHETSEVEPLQLGEALLAVSASLAQLSPRTPPPNRPTADDLPVRTGILSPVMTYALEHCTDKGRATVTISALRDAIVKVLGEQLSPDLLRRLKTDVDDSHERELPETWMTSVVQVAAVQGTQQAIRR
jgi:hypothetical protein